MRLMNQKAYFSPYLFTSFFGRLETGVIAARCELWGQFLSSHGIRFPTDCIDAIEKQLKDKTTAAQSDKRLVLRIPHSKLNRQTHFEFQFFSALLPTCQCGFVHGNMNFENDTIMEILEQGLADVMNLPVFGR